MIMRAIVAIGTIMAEKVDVAHVDLLNSLDFIFIVLDCRINALAVLIPWYLVSIFQS